MINPMLVETESQTQIRLRRQPSNQAVEKSIGWILLAIGGVMLLAIAASGLARVERFTSEPASQDDYAQLRETAREGRVEVFSTPQPDSKGN